ncbi:hypothetical protein EVAR_81319_1 [Eumeta japonica]|uniref:Uncharacterized protein n=1 Tax=Eumeta variegata TaxID=151549 RepID=A0A4C1W2I3_EUMVA|nr:hypothetical protein EVAR_81319_1 [Eumeta japonica]
MRVRRYFSKRMFVFLQNSADRRRLARAVTGRGGDGAGSTAEHLSHPPIILPESYGSWGQRLRAENYVRSAGRTRTGVICERSALDGHAAPQCQPMR